jgi:hypothetical protein
MKTIFRFENGNSQLMLIPESEREKRQCQLFNENSGEIKLSNSPGSPESLMFTTDNYAEREAKD